MAVEDAADLAGFFEDSEFAAAAVFTPSGGSGVPVTLLMARPQVSAGLGGLGISAPQRIALVRKSEIAAPARGDALAVGAETLIVKEVTLDDSGLIWRLGLAA